MGYAIARAAVEAGARVTLVSGPVSLETPNSVQRHDVVTAQQMHDVVMGKMNDVDIFISTAAVADYRPDTIHAQKIKKNAETLQINMVKNPDILSTVKQRYPACFCVGFAAETKNLQDYAISKLKEKINKKLIDCITFFSPSAVNSFVQLIGEESIDQIKMQNIQKYEYINWYYEYGNAYHFRRFQKMNCNEKLGSLSKSSRRGVRNPGELFTNF